MTKTNVLKRFTVISVLFFLVTVKGCGSGNPQSPTPLPTPPPLPPSTRSSPPRGVTDQHVKDGDIVVPLILVDDKPLARLTVGTPVSTEVKDQEFSVYVNIASGDVWLSSEYLEEKLDRNALTFRMYSKEKSTKGKRNPLRREQIKGRDYEVRGFCSSDVFKIGGTRTIQLEQQWFLEVDDIVHRYENYDGMLGLGFSTDSECVTPFVQNLETMSQHVAPIFGIYINKLPNDKEFGSLVIGGNDEGLMKESPQSYDVVKEGDKYTRWSISIDRIVVIRHAGDGGRNDVPLGPDDNTFTLSPEEDEITFTAGPRNALYDLMFKDVEFDRLNEHFDSGVAWDTLPDVVFVIGGREYLMTPHDYVRCGGNKCRSSITRAKGRPILGRPFMTKFYTRFDIKNKQVQIAESSGVY